MTVHRKGEKAWRLPPGLFSVERSFEFSVQRKLSSMFMFDGTPHWGCCDMVR
jgi:hypothetical protein